MQSSKMVGHVVVGSLIACLLSATAASAWSLRDLLPKSFEDQLTESCEKVLQERLLAPSTYKRIEKIGFEQHKASLDEYLGWETPEIKARGIANMDRNEQLRKLHEASIAAYDREPYTYSSVLISYDAANAYWTPLRGAVKCSVVTSSPEKLSDFDKTQVRVDGYTSFDWIITHLK